MKRAPIYYPRVFEDPDDAKEYAAKHAKMGKRIGKKFARELAGCGFHKGKILDVGGGSGEVTVELTLAFPEAEVVCMDLSEPLLEMAESLVEKRGLSDRISCRKGDALAMPFKDNSFEAVVSANTLHVVDNPERMLKEIYRVLAPDGIIWLRDIRRSWIGLLDPVFKTGYSAREMKDLLARRRLRNWTLKTSLLWLDVVAGKPPQHTT